MNSARLAYLFHRYTERSCSDEERQEFYELLHSGAHDDQVKASIDELWQTLGDHEKADPHRAEKIITAIIGSDTHVIPVPRKQTSFTWIRMAAAILIVALSTITIYWLSSDGQTIVTHDVITSAPADDHNFVKLPDGTTVILNEGSELTYPSDFDNSATREVILTGEGYFDVKEDHTKPFIVVTGKLKTTVLGTAFNVKAYPNDKSITVTVTRGKVRVSENEKVIGIITPNQQITFNESDNRSEQRDVDSGPVVAWRERDIFFDDLTMTDAIHELEKRFDVDIELRNEKLKDCRFTATFVRGEDIDQILTVICEFNGASFETSENGTIFISGTGCR